MEQHPTGGPGGAPSQGGPGQGGQNQGPQGQGVSPDQIVANISNEAQQGWTMLWTMIFVRLRLDEAGATREERQEMIGFWHESFVQPHIDRWCDTIDTPQNRNALMGGPVTADDLMDRIRMLGPQLQSKFMTYIMRGVNDPVDSLGEAVADFKALRNERTQEKGGAAAQADGQQETNP